MSNMDYGGREGRGATTPGLMEVAKTGPCPSQGADFLRRPGKASSMGCINASRISLAATKLDVENKGACRQRSHTKQTSQP
ncbi:unnamed protein product [Calypogeia fissa]